MRKLAWKHSLYFVEEQHGHCKGNYFQRADVNKSDNVLARDALDSDEFVQFFKLLTKRPELEEIMKWYSSTKDSSFTAHDLLDFLVNEQDVG